MRMKVNENCETPENAAGKPKEETRGALYIEELAMRAQRETHVIYVRSSFDDCENNFICRKYRNHIERRSGTKYMKNYGSCEMLSCRFLRE